ncbi:MAG: methyltransferase [Elusimicrobia bacterium RIFOXYA1_FULL_47_7]|nr:MAG: methyltransferase [Elusimicrobia bacterium RIFOXYA12_FULL_49_49]OGS09701.1 MAG: methyltransferase [Elusimicrobia bacterium RIFOXYA1_FULL_47_7]OGS10303.1 MAG: methyltransferase [Elusimicrobia bacterium RIFOXYB1_FULL_48_9]OGS16800.1 MAG: methyltransferase [Elusimicrobia bacterium RIFOXYA2_FULL_47_53]OGS32028.1 MAG: methyltransferase [Elusimicrobia bacterium RIFOXYB2_FULL_46_23]
MNQRKCRTCRGELFQEPLLSYKNMPKGAQFFPGPDEIKSEKGVDLDIFQCSACGLVQLSIEPVPYYREVIRSAGISDAMKSFRAGQFSEFISKYSLASKKILELGCGKGEYLSIMNGLGVDAYGIEYSDESVEDCRKLGLKVEKAYIDSSLVRLKNAPFDSFYILNFLEHMPNAVDVLKGIWANLADKAVGLVEVPNFDMIIRNKMFAEFIPDHLFYFTRDTLLNTLSLAGFDVIECVDIWHDYIISARVRKNPVINTAVMSQVKSSINLSSFYEQEKLLKSNISKYLAGLKGKKVAVWGAGHQALALISLTGMASQIEYIVDSAPFKQGRYSPATHIPIVAPEQLLSQPVDSLIIMAGGYSEEVAKIVKNRYSGKMSLAILRDSGPEPII